MRQTVRFQRIKYPFFSHRNRQPIKEDDMLNETSRLSDLASPFDGETDRTLLLIDDDRVSRERLARALERKGFDVRATDSVREGIAIARAEQPAFAVMELRLGDG